MLPNLELTLKPTMHFGKYICWFVYSHSNGRRALDQYTDEREKKNSSTCNNKHTQTHAYEWYVCVCVSVCRASHLNIKYVCLYRLYHYTCMLLYMTRIRSPRFCELVHIFLCRCCLSFPMYVYVNTCVGYTLCMNVCNLFRARAWLDVLRQNRNSCDMQRTEREKKRKKNDHKKIECHSDKSSAFHSSFGIP